MNTLAPLFIVLALLIVTVVLLKMLGLPGFVPLKNAKAGSSEHEAEDGAS